MKIAIPTQTVPQWLADLGSTEARAVMLEAVALLTAGNRVSLRAVHLACAERERRAAQLDLDPATLALVRDLLGDGDLPGEALPDGPAASTAPASDQHATS